jgi:hypothetical protein
MCKYELKVGLGLDPLYRISGVKGSKPEDSLQVPT